MADVGAWLCRTSLVVALVLGCGGSNGREYAAAATGLAATVGATGLYRAHTGNCWANCSPGYACDRTRGLCYRAECLHACAANQTCYIESNDTFRCIDDFGSGQFGAPSPAPFASAAPISSVAPPASSASPN